RPAAVPRHHLHCLHVDGVDVGTLFTIDLDGDKVVIEDCRDRFVLERLALHHVAPVTRRVADREEHRLVLAPRFRERLVAPGIPVDRVVRVLQEVRRRFFGQTVHSFPSVYCATPTPFTSMSTSTCTMSLHMSCTCTRSCS